MNFASSAHNIGELAVHRKGKSLMNIKNNKGERFDPWGTPLVTTINFDK